MLYLIHGKDSFRSRCKLNELLGFLGAESANFGFFRAEVDNFKEEEFEELLKSRSLFSNKNIVVCEGLSERENFFKFVSERFGRCAKSENIFIFLEGDILSGVSGLFKKSGAEIHFFDSLSGFELEEWITGEEKKQGIKLPLSVKREIINRCGSDLWSVSKEIEKISLGGSAENVITEKYNPFAICDAISGKNKTKSWIIFQKAILAGVPAEEVFWKIAWQIKNLLLVKKLSRIRGINLAKESGLKPYPLKKAMSSAGNFTEKELSDYSSELINLYSGARKGKADFLIGLEKFLVNL